MVTNWDLAMRKLYALGVGCFGVVATAIPLLVHAQAYGPDTCVSGFVWRDAFSNDHVCVVPAVRTQAQQDNAQAKYRVSAVNGQYGSDTCRAGYVWREASPSDHVCVVPSVRDATRADNAAANQRYVNR
jgi:hypothetical protein